VQRLVDLLVREAELGVTELRRALPSLARFSHALDALDDA
jgi:hypothetical protein